MAQTAKPQHIVTTSDSSAKDLRQESMRESPAAYADQQAFYDDYREAVRELRAGNPKRFLDYQEDPRIKPPLESRAPVKEAPGTVESVSIVNAERASLVTDAKVALISLATSVRSITSAITSLFN